MSIKRLSLDNAQNLMDRYSSDLKALDFQANEVKKLIKELGTHIAKLKKAAAKKSAAAAKKKAAAAKKKAAAAKKKAAAAAKKKAAAAKKKAAAAAKKKAAAAKKKTTAKRKPAARKKTARKTTTRRKAGRPAKKAAAKRKTTTRRKVTRKTTARKPAAKRKATGAKRGRKMSYSNWDMLVMNTLKGTKSPVRTSTLLSKGQTWAKKNKVDSSEKYVRGKIGASLIKLVNKTKDVKKIAAEGRGYAYKLA